MAQDAIGLESAEAGPSRLGLRRVEPYWHEYRTNCKQRWAGRTLLEVFVTEFRDRTSEYYQWAIHKGYCRVNDCKSEPDYVLKMNDQIQNKLHRHEAPVTADPIRILHRNDDEGRLVIVKPGSIPVHPAGRHHKTTLVEMLKSDHGIDKVATSNRLDRLTSGIMICTTKKEAAQKLAEQFAMSKVRKAYVCRVRGQFPRGVTFVEEPLLIVDRQSGVSIVHPLGKYAATHFEYMWYDDVTDTTAVFCRPITGRTHQIRVHAQWLGHPIPNDPVYANAAWDKHPPLYYKALPLKPDRWKVDPGSTLSVYGAQEVDDLIAGLKIDRDDREDWARWRDEMLFGQMLQKEGIELIAVPGPNGESPAEQRSHNSTTNSKSHDDETKPKLSDVHKGHFCEECQVPLIPDPKPEDLFIYLHAIKYETDEWSYQDSLPWWARKDWNRGVSERNVADDPMDGFVMPSLRDASYHLGEVSVKKSGQAEMFPISELDEQTSLAAIAETTIPHTPLCRINHPAVIFEVFSGLEDVAAHDVSSRLIDALGSEEMKEHAVTYTRHSGHIFVEAGPLAHAAMALFLQGHINCVKDAYMEIAEKIMPQDILDDMASEKHAYHVLVSKANHARKLMRKGHECAKETEVDTVPASPAGLPRTEAESRLLSAMEEAWLQSSAQRDFAFQHWQAISNSPKTEDREGYPSTFRASVDRTGYAMPTLTSVTFERALGSLAWDWLNGGSDSEEEKCKVQLTTADLDVTLKLLPDSQETESHWRLRDSNPPGRFVFMFHVKSRGTRSHRPAAIPNSLVKSGTPLARFRGYTLSTMLPFPTSRLCAPDHSEEPLKIWEPCAGTGSLAVELIGALDRRQIRHDIFASDLSTADTDKAREMLALCNTPIAKLGTLDATNAASAVDFIGGENVLDAIITDLPWGRRVLNHMTIAKLYPAVLHTFSRVLRPGGVVLCMTADHRTMLRAIKIHEADARKRDLGWTFRVENVNARPMYLPALHDAESQQQQQRAQDDTNDEDVVASIEVLERRVRIVQCGYMVGVLLLRKVPVIA